MSRNLRPVLIAAVLIANLFVSCLLAYMLSAARDQRENEIRTTVENMALLLDLSVTEAVGAIDLSLRATTAELEEHLRRHGGFGDLDVNALLEGQRKWGSALLPTLRVTDASGTVRYCAGCVVAPRDSLADHDFFAAHHDRKDKGMIVSDLSVDRLTNAWVIFFTRRYDDADGRFAGMISASVPASAFATLFAGIDLGPHGVAALRDANMALIARIPPTDDPSPPIGSKLYSPELADIIASGDAARTYHAVQAGTGIERTLAYRRLSVMPIHLVVGMGTEDYLAGWRGLIRKAVAVAATFLAGSTLLAWLLWRSFRLTEVANERSHFLFRNASDGIHILDLQHNVIEVSDAFCQMLGYSATEMAGMNASNWDARSIGGAPVDFNAKADEKFDILTFEAQFQRKDGSCLDVEITVRPLELVGQKMFFCSARDISRRKAAEAQSQRLSNLYAALSQCNQAIVHCVDEAELFLKICHCAVEFGLVKTAWIGLVDETSKQVTPAAWYGDGDIGFLDHIPLMVDPADPRGRGPTGRAIRDNLPQWSQDFLRDPTTTPWHEYGQKAGWRASATLPLRRSGVPIGCLVLYSSTLNAFDEEARKLLIEMAMDISFALDNFAREADRQRSAEALQASETRYRLAFQTSADAISINRLSDGLYIDVNDGFLEMSGFSRDDIIGRSSFDINIWSNLDDRRKLVERLKYAEIYRNLEVQFRKKNGDLFWGLLSASLIELNGERCILLVTRDISNIKMAEDEIKTLAFYDPLTHLPNRRLLTDRLHHALAVATRNKRICALLFIDLDNFKTLNDSCGHTIGDLLLQDVAKRITDCVRKADTVARLGGDEFVVLIEELSENLEEAATRARDTGEKILYAIGQPYLLAGRQHRSTTSIGITMFGGRDESSDALLTQADIAMYQAKTAGRNTLRFFSPDLQAAINSRVEIEDDLHRAIGTDEFSLHYQPQVDPGGLVGAEVLIRWNHPRRGMVAPNAFIPLAEETGLILPLGQWVLEAACRQIAVWTAQKDTAHLTLAVNVSALQFRQPDFIEQTIATLKRFAANPQNLKLELTESMLVDNVEDVITKMTALRAYGVRFSLDDFGTGYSSLSLLKRLPLDQLKIDRSFVKDVLADANDAAIAKTIVGLGQTMGLSVIAEGVETEAQRDFLSGLGCHSFQGFLFGRPLPLDEFQMLIRQGAVSPPRQ